MSRARPASLRADQVSARFRTRRRLLLGVGFGLSLLCPTLSFGQATRPSFVAVDGPAAPIAPDVISRDAMGRATVRAVRLTEPLTIDGRLDERLYVDTPSFGDFIQQEPRAGQPATDKTEVWVAYDAEALYVSARLFEEDSSRRVTSDMRRDSNNLYNNDHFAIYIDTFYDHRNGYNFSANAQGGIADNQITNEDGDGSWNAIWDVKAADFEGGWSVEFRIPFRSIRFKEGSSTWGINFRRMVRWKTEASFLTPISPAFGRGALNRGTYAATLVGLEVPTKVMNLDVKPYLLGSSLTNRRARPAINNDGNGEFGTDAKWTINQSLVADFTYNTDFAQVEDDEQQVNLTRFSLFFPEKRDFFIEGQSLFAFGGAQTFVRNNANTNNNITAAANDTPIPFFSRRIGLEGSSVVPILGGGRLLGRLGPYQFGAITMRTDETRATPAVEYSVFRVYRDILRRSRIGVIATDRSPSDARRGQLYGADASFTFATNTEIVGYVSKTATAGRHGDDTSYKGRYEWNADRWGVIGEHLYVGDNFNPEVGFLRREPFRRSLGVFRFSPRTPRSRLFRKRYFEGSLDYYTRPEGGVQSRYAKAAFRTDLRNGDAFQLDASNEFEGLLQGFDVAKRLSVPAGEYAYSQVGGSYTFGPQRKISGTASTTHGSFYDGTLHEMTFRMRVEFSGKLYAEPTVSWNSIDLPRGVGHNNLMSTRVTYTLNPRMFVSALVQYQSRSDSVTTNARFRWEYLPGSELFVVYSDGRNTLTSGIPDLDNRSIIIKATRLFRF